jgi:hypothetical protein
MSKNRVFEIELRVKAHQQPDAVISREYTSHEKASTDGVAGEIWEGVADAVKAKMKSVADGN